MKLSFWLKYFRRNKIPLNVVQNYLNHADHSTITEKNKNLKYQYQYELKSNHVSVFLECAKMYFFHNFFFKRAPEEIFEFYLQIEYMRSEGVKDEIIPKYFPPNFSLFRHC